MTRDTTTDTDSLQTREHSSVNRRTVLGMAALGPLTGVRSLIERLFRGNQAAVVEKRLVGVEGSDVIEIARTGADGTEIASRHDGLFEGAPGVVDDATAQQLRSRYDELRFFVGLRHHADSASAPEDDTPVEYETSRALYNGMDVGDHVSFQTSLLNPNTIISLSCLTDSEESLRPRCRVDIDDPTDEI